MGRKIPGKKHKGVKDPEKQRRKRLNSLKGKINVPPPNPDFQEVPHSVNRIAELKEQIKNRKSPKKYKQEQHNSNSKINVQHKTKNRKKKEIAFQQIKGESDKQYLHRVHKACDAVIHEKAFEIKYGVDIKRNPITGEVDKLVKRPKDEIEQLIKEVRTNKKRKKKSSTEPVLTKSQKRQKKLNEKKQKKLGMKELTLKQDVVGFGEVVHAPPTLTAPRKALTIKGAARPGERNLLLKSLMSNTKSDNNTKQAITEQTVKKTANKVIDKTGKRKNLPNALRRRLDKQQAEIIDAYRTLKKQRGH